MVSMLSLPIYASEICLLALRGVVTASVKLALIIGQCTTSGVAASLESRSEGGAYKASLTVQIIINCFAH